MRRPFTAQHRSRVLERDLALGCIGQVEERDRTPGCRRGLANAFWPVEEHGGQVVQKIWTPLNTNDFAPFLAQIKPDADAVLALMVGRLALQFMKQYEETGRKARQPLLGGGTTTDESVLPQMGNESLGVITALHYSQALDNPANQKFAKAFEAKAGKIASYYSEACYTNARWIAEAVKAVGVEDRVRVIERDAAAGLTGTYDLVVAFDVLHDLPHPDVVLRGIADALRPGGLLLAWEPDPAERLEDMAGPVGALRHMADVVYCMTTALAVGGEGIVSTTLLTVASPSAKTASMICRSRRLSSDGSGISTSCKAAFPRATQNARAECR